MNLKISDQRKFLALEILVKIFFESDDSVALFKELSLIILLSQKIEYKNPLIISTSYLAVPTSERHLGTQNNNKKLYKEANLIPLIQNNIQSFDTLNNNEKLKIIHGSLDGKKFDKNNRDN
jgi:hypothetical protein